ncbi:uncharacterized protein LOC117327168 [Pecten maximus]|uniref:uncharacterized protein LOC117327168 n=1 Tax=Pecten maximus TaxID=6579 RepID=UPI0014582EB0|nr:uncharacterized protein LOC117327168 [Pecten maximus]
MSRTTILWSLIMLVKIVLVTAGQYQKVPEEYLKQSGQDNQMVTIQFLICSPHQSASQTEGQSQTEREGQTECQGLQQVSNCSLQINSKITELFFTNATSTDGGDQDISTSYRTLLDFSSINNSIKILPSSLFIPDLLLKGAFIFDLRCGTIEAEVVTIGPSKVTAEPITPLTENISNETPWIITIGILAGTLTIFIIACLICQCKRKRSKTAALSIKQTHCPKKSHREDKEFWQLNPQTQVRERDFQPEDQPKDRKERKRYSWNLRPKSWKIKCKKQTYVNTEILRKTEHGKGRETDSTISIESHDSYVPMDNYTKGKQPNCGNDNSTGTQLPKNDLKFCY